MRLLFEDEVRWYAQIARHSTKCGRQGSWLEASAPNQRYWLSDDPISWVRNPSLHLGNIAIDGSLVGGGDILRSGAVIWCWWNHDNKFRSATDH